ncbi:MAG: hypothetical protein ABIS47_10985 [Acidimicrobiales bacterium]
MPDQVGPPFDAVLAAAQTGAGWAAERVWTSLAPAVAGYLRSQGATAVKALQRRALVHVREVLSLEGVPL